MYFKVALHVRTDILGDSPTIQAALPHNPASHTFAQLSSHFSFKKGHYSITNAQLRSRLLFNSFCEEANLPRFSATLQHKDTQAKQLTNICAL